MKKELVLFSLMVATFLANAQNVGVGTTTPHSSAQLDITSITKGILVPRMTAAQRIAIPLPATGLLVFDTESNSFWYYNGSAWSNLSNSSTGWQLIGNSGTDTSVNYIGTMDNKPLKFKVNNQRAGLIGSNGNVFWGPGSGTNMPAAIDNIAIGRDALNKNASEGTIAIGAFALANNTSGVQNSAIGAYALQNNTNGGFNVVFGNNNLVSQITGTGNTAIGSNVLVSHIRGNVNTAVGANALYNDTSGNDNAALGYFSLFNNLNGNKNTAVGNQALSANKTGNNNLAVGYKADVLTDNLQNASAIGTLSRVDCSDCMVLGSINGINGALSNVNVGIGTSNPSRPLSFPALVGKKISMYPGASGDVGFGVYGNELRIHSDHPGADITFGYDDYTLGFAERMRIKGDGNVGIGTNFPTGRLHVIGGSAVFSGPGSYVSLPTAPPPMEGNGRRMMWFHDRAAFRAGYVNSTNWDNDSIGAYSVAFGMDTKASGYASTAMGLQSVASNIFATAIGTQAIASGEQTIAIGAQSVASGSVSTAIGAGTIAKSYFETSLGSYNTDYTPLSTFWDFTDRLLVVGNGQNSTSRSDALVILKNGNTGIGKSNPSNKLHVFNGLSGATPFADFFTPMVVENNTHTYINLLCPEIAETGILFGKPSNAASGGILYNNTGTLNGLQFRTNGNITRMQIYDNGNAWLQGTLTQASDSRLKKDIIPLQNSLKKITQLNGYNYNWKNENVDSSLQTGLIAQEVRKLFPELVKEDKEGMLSVNYSGLIPVLIESVKDQQKQIDELKKLVEKLARQ